MVGISIVQDGIFQAVSPLAASFTGYDAPERIGRRSGSMINPDDLARVEAEAKAMLAGKRSDIARKERPPRISGTRVPVVGNAFLFKSANLSPWGP